MEVLRTAAAVREWRPGAGPVGLVPTMGALHDGHAALVDRAVRENVRVIASIFVNPTQFGPGDDYTAYPRSIDMDLELLHERGEELGCELLSVHRQVISIDLSFSPMPGLDSSSPLSP